MGSLYKAFADIETVDIIKEEEAEFVSVDILNKLVSEEDMRHGYYYDAAEEEDANEDMFEADKKGRNMPTILRKTSHSSVSTMETTDCKNILIANDNCKSG